MMLKASLVGMVLCLALSTAIPLDRSGMERQKGGGKGGRSTGAPGVTKEARVRFCSEEGQKPDCGDSKLVKSKGADLTCEDGSVPNCIDFAGDGEKGGMGRKGSSKGGDKGDRKKGNGKKNGKARGQNMGGK